MSLRGSLVVSHPVGNANVRAVLDVLQTNDRLAAFHTTFAAKGEQAPRWLPGKLAAQWQRRRYPVPDAKLHQRPVMELLRQTAGRHVGGTANQWVNRVCRDLDKHVASWLKNTKTEGLKGMYAYEDCAALSFKVARERGLRCFYDLPIAYWQLSQKLMREELQRWPDWAGTMQGVNDSEEKLACKDEELRQCDVVMCCSKFVLDSLPEWARAKKQCVVAEFGSDIDKTSQDPADRDDGSNRRLRVLFVGSMTQRKGLADLMAAVKLVGSEQVELVILGQPVEPIAFYREQGEFRHEGTRPRSKVLELMRSCDVFVLPSLVEGRALVQQEALSCGLPIIITANTGGEDLIDEGETGFLVPIRSAEEIAKRLEWFCRNRKELPAMREHARKKAALYTWQEYGRKILAAVEGGLTSP